MHVCRKQRHLRYCCILIKCLKWNNARINLSRVVSALRKRQFVSDYDCVIKTKLHLCFGNFLCFYDSTCLDNFTAVPFWYSFLRIKEYVTNVLVFYLDRLSQLMITSCWNRQWGMITQNILKIMFRFVCCNFTVILKRGLVED